MTNLYPTQSDSLLNLAEWTNPTRVNTKKGSMIERRAPMNKPFKTMWQRNRDSLSKQGITVDITDRVTRNEVIIWTQDPQSFNADLQRWRKEVKKFEASNLKFKIDERGLLDYQAMSVKRNLFALRKYGFSLEASDTGYGKTYIGCAIARELGLKLCVVAPKKARSTWRKVVKFFNTACTVKELPNQTPIGPKPTPIELVFVHNVEKLKFGKTEFGQFVTKFDADGKPDQENGKEMLDSEGFKKKQWVWNLPPDVLLIIDEVHKFKGVNSANAELFLAASDLNIPVLAISATAANDPSAMRALGKALNIHDGTDADFHRWALENGCVVTWSTTLKFIGGNDTLQYLHKDIFPEHGNRQRAADLDSFPETQITADAYDLGANAKHVQAAYDEFADELAKIEANLSDAKCRLTVMLRLRQKTELLKVPLMLEMARDLEEEGYSVALFVNFNETLDQLAKGLKTNCTISGNVTSRIREQNIADFQANHKKAHFMVLNTASGGESISLHDLTGERPRASIISPDWSSYNAKQVMGRIHRAGGKSKSIQRLIYAGGTIEEQVADNVNKKLQNMGTLNDSDMDCSIVLMHGR